MVHPNPIRSNLSRFQRSLFAVAIMFSLRLLSLEYFLKVSDAQNSYPTDTELDLDADLIVNTVDVQRYKDTNYKDVVPLRDERTKIVSRACVQSSDGGIYLKHFRKAGGTSLMVGVRQGGICQRQTPFFGSEYPYFNSRTFDALGTSIFITSMRHPIDRIMSMYWFDGRWPRTCGRACEDKKIKNDDTKVADLDEWIEAVHDQTDYKDLQYRRHTSCGQWTSVENYYIRTLLGIDSAATRDEKKTTKYEMGFLNKTITREHLHRAKEILASLDLVMIQEHMKSKDSSMAKMFYAITGTSDATELPHFRETTEKDNTERKKMVSSSRATIDRLHEWNALDIELYNYAVDLSKQTVDRWVAVGKQEQEELMNNAFNVSESCQKPPMKLDGTLLETALGGNDCTNKVRFMLGGKCYQTSMEQKRY